MKFSEKLFELRRQKGMSQEQAILAALEGIKKTSLKVNLILLTVKPLIELSIIIDIGRLSLNL